MATPEIEMKDIDFRVIPTGALTADDLDQVRRLFDHAYDQANYEYLEKSFAKLRFISLAVFKEELVGFGVGDAVETTLPRITDPQVVLLGGICCVASNYRRLGLFRHLENMAFQTSDQMRPATRYLACGRVGTSFR